MDEEPPRIKLDYHKPASVFPTDPKDAFIFWGCLSVMLCILFALMVFGIVGGLMIR